LRVRLRPKGDGEKKNCEKQQRLQAPSSAFWHESGDPGTELVFQVNEAFGYEGGRVRPIVGTEKMSPITTNNYSGQIYPRATSQARHGHLRNFDSETLYTKSSA
jgi:hypothetical protein